MEPDDALRSVLVRTLLRRGIVVRLQHAPQHLLAALPGLAPAMALACASGNAARAFHQPGGLIAEGQPADLILCRPAPGAPYADALEALAQGGWLHVDTVLVEGEVQRLGDARVVAAEAVGWSR